MCKLNISWNGTELSHCINPSYLCVKLDRSLTYRAHVEKLRAKVAAQNNILHKLSNSKWGVHPATIHSISLALCYSTAEYACPVWSHSAYAKKINPMLNESCCCITGCLKPSNITSLYILSGISPPDIRREVASRKERTVQVADPRHPLYGQFPACSWLKSRKSFLATTKPLDEDAASTRMQLWKERLATDPTPTSMELSPVEKLPPGTDAPWKNWRCLNRLKLVLANAGCLCNTGAIPMIPLLATADTLGKPWNIFWNAQAWNQSAVLRTWQSSIAEQVHAWCSGHQLFDTREEVVQTLQSHRINMTWMIDMTKKKKEEKKGIHGYAQLSIFEEMVNIINIFTTFPSINFGGLFICCRTLYMLGTSYTFY